mmetsp:Transcript_13863/g.22060  ORF Transcript_13863/g.22060 Transcript_13863/m.22060 type:complete len:92 (+) Transcript_13863:2589-2864(+)
MLCSMARAKRWLSEDHLRVLVPLLVPLFLLQSCRNPCFFDAACRDQVLQAALSALDMLSARYCAMRRFQPDASFKSRGPHQSAAELNNHVA